MLSVHLGKSGFVVCELSIKEEVDVDVDSEFWGYAYVILKFMDCFVSV